MRLVVLLFAAGLLVAPSVGALELVQNGTFEQELSVGWEQHGWGGAGYVYRSDAYQPDPDYEVMVGKTTGTGAYSLKQLIPIPTIDIEFSCDVRITASANSEAWSAAALILAYTDRTGLVLGETRIYERSSLCPWTESPTLRLLRVPDTDWNTYAFNIATELGNLPGVDPSAVEAIYVSLHATAADC